MEGMGVEGAVKKGRGGREGGDAGDERREMRQEGQRKRVQSPAY